MACMMEPSSTVDATDVVNRGRRSDIAGTQVCDARTHSAWGNAPATASRLAGGWFVRNWCTRRCTSCRCTCTTSRAFVSIMMRGISAILLFAVFACGPTKGGNSGDDGGGDDAGNNPPADAEIYFDSPIDSSCGAQTENIGVMNLGDPPDLLVVLDRSGSMTSPPPVFPPIFDSKWLIMKNALIAITTQKDMQIKF